MEYRLEKFCNLEFIISSSYDINSLLELKSFKCFFDKLVNLLGPKSIFNFYVFWGQKCDELYLINSIKKLVPNHNVLFWIGDEEGYIPSDGIFDKFSFIFKMHLNDKAAIKIENGEYVFKKGLYHFPLLTIDDVPELPILPLQERKYKLYFCGNLNENRVPFYIALNKKASLLARLDNFLLKYNLRGGNRLYELCFRNKSFDISHLYDNACIKFYNGFNNGDNYNQYAHFLQNSKIVLSPKGFHSTECFRFYEAMRQGCIVITEELPKVPCYKNAPCITINNWRDLPKIINDSVLLNFYTADEIKNFYNKKLSPYGIAEYVFNILTQKICQ